MIWFTTACWLVICVVWLRALRRPQATDATETTWTRRDDRMLHRLLSEGDSHGHSAVERQP